MKAAYIREHGPSKNIIYGEIPDPKPGATECLVRVRAVAVNPVDTYIRAGTIPMNVPMPFVVGCDLCGTVEAVGGEVKRFKAGDRVWGSNQGLLGRQGTFGELAAVDERWLYPAPDGVSDDDLAAIALVGITAHLGLVRDGQLRNGEIVFVNGGSGGVGSTVVQMAKILGAKVITTAGSEEKQKICRDLGADLAIRYREEDVAKEIKRFAPDGVNLWWETLREPDFDRTIDCLAERGRMILMAGRDARPPFPVGPFYVKGATVRGFVMFKASAEEQREAAEDINEWLLEGRLKPRIDRVMKLAEAAQAHELQESATVHKRGSLAGKIVLRP